MRTFIKKYIIMNIKIELKMFKKINILVFKLVWSYYQDMVKFKNQCNWNNCAIQYIPMNCKISFLYFLIRFVVVNLEVTIQKI